jgi:hypothetical protein
MTRRNRFVSRETVRRDLSDDDWIEIKAALSYGEEQNLNASAFRALRDGEDGQGEVTIDWAARNLNKIEAWVVEWSFRSDQDRPMPVTKGNIKNLDADTAREILETIDAYMVEQERIKKGLPPTEESNEPPTAISIVS